MDNLWRYAEIDCIDIDKNLLTLKIHPGLISRIINPSGVIKLCEADSVLLGDCLVIDNGNLEKT